MMKASRISDRQPKKATWGITEETTREAKEETTDSINTTGSIYAESRGRIVLVFDEGIYESSSHRSAS